MPGSCVYREHNTAFDLNFRTIRIDFSFCMTDNVAPSISNLPTIEVFISTGRICLIDCIIKSGIFRICTNLLCDSSEGSIITI